MAYETTYQTIREIYSKFNELGIKNAYLVGGISAAIQSNQPLYRQNEDVDLMVNSSELEKIIQALSDLGYTVSDKRGPLTENLITSTGEFVARDHELNADLPKRDTSKLGIGLFVYSRENGVVSTHSYAFDQRKGATIGSRTEMPEELFDLMYDDNEITYSGVPLKCQSKAYTYYSKSRNTRPKDRQDVEALEPFIGENESREIERIQKLEKRSIRYEEIFDGTRLISQKRLPSLDQNMEAYIAQLLGDNLENLSPEECKKIIFSSPEVLQFMAKDKDINTIMKIFYKCSPEQNIKSQIGEIAHSYIFDDDFSANKFLKDKQTQNLEER